MRPYVGTQSIRALRHAIASLVLVARFLAATLTLWLLDFLCIRNKVLLRRSEQADSPDDPPVRVSDSSRLFSLESIKAIWYGLRLDVFKSAHLGFVAPNTEVVQLGEQTKVRILDFAKGNSDIADSLLVYIEEAHPCDGWVSSDAPYQIPKHRCLEDRMKAAQLMNVQIPECLVVMDNMENSSNAAYGAYFERLYILKDERVVYQGGRGPEGYKIAEVRNWLAEYRSSLAHRRPLVIQV
ncbi:thyroxine 5-deiodinase [Arapaima gigas]